MNRRQRRAAWLGVISDLYEDLEAPGSAQRGAKISTLILIAQNNNPYDRDWDQWYEDGDGTVD